MIPHELAHTSVGRLLCGCRGRRNFNVWTLCVDCAAEPPLTLLATFAGPACLSAGAAVALRRHLGTLLAPAS